MSLYGNAYIYDREKGKSQLLFLTAWPKPKRIRVRNQRWVMSLCIVKTSNVTQHDGAQQVVKTPPKYTFRNGLGTATSQLHRTNEVHAMGVVERTAHSDDQRFERIRLSKREGGNYRTPSRSRNTLPYFFAMPTRFRWLRSLPTCSQFPKIGKETGPGGAPLEPERENTKKRRRGRERREGD